MSVPNAVADVQNDLVTLTWSDGTSAVFPTIWLRDNCRCPKCRHASGQRLFEITDLPETLNVAHSEVEAGRLTITWSPDNHVSSYGLDWLRAHDLAPDKRAARYDAPVLWGAVLKEKLPVADWQKLQQDMDAELAWHDDFAAYGFGVLRNVPTESGMVEVVGNHLGFVRVTNYGSRFDVVSVPNPNNLAFTAVGLGVHSDNPYREPTPGVQLLHCLESNAPGGDTLLVDGFHAAEILRQEDPVAFDLLCTHPFTFRFQDAKADLQATVPLIKTDYDGHVIEVHFNNRSADMLDVPVEFVAPWYAAYRRFAEILKRPELELIFRLGPGDLVVMMNERALHGRTTFDPQLGRRHLQGCYIDKDGIESRRRLLRRQLRKGQEIAA